MRNLVLFMHTSLDGFVAGTQGEMDWIHVDEEIFDYSAERTNQADTALYGRKTYQMMEGYWPTAADQPNPTRHDIEHSRWYKKVTKVVLSRTMQGANLANTKIISQNLKDEIIRLKQGPGKEIVIFGSPGAAHALMAENLIDDYWLFVNPILLGQGIPLFKNIPEKIALTLVASHVFSSGVVCMHHTCRRDPAGMTGG
jgi:dihydrofolate reductase